MRLTLCGLFVLWTSAASAQDCFRDSIGLEPVQPTLTLAQWNAGLTAASRIVPRLVDGTPSSSGRTVFLSVGMSNTGRVWRGFRGLAKPMLRPGLRLLSGAQNNQAAAEWANPACACWAILDELLAKVGASRVQVGAVFLMLTNQRPTLSPEQNATLFVAHIHTVLDQLAARFPYLQVVYLTSNYYGGYDVGQDKTPEPHDYLEGTTLQAIQDARLSRPWVSTASVYLWADGARPRTWDGLTLRCEELSGDGVHLNDLGIAHYGRHLFEALRDDPTTYGWLWK